MRDAFGETLVELGAEISDLVVVGADTTGSLKSSMFGARYPKRFFNVGIAEQNMIGIAAGLALTGKTVVCGTYAVFVPGRAVDQIRNTIAYCNLNVKIIVSHGGVSVGPDGGSHQALEDIAIMRTMPNMRVIVPADAVSTRVLTRQACKTPGPFYIRLARPSSQVIYSPSQELKIGKAEVLREGSDVTIIANGLLLEQALKASDRLKEHGISACVMDCHTVKPLDSSALIESAKQTGAIVTAEEHNFLGGLGSAVAELLSSEFPVKIKMVGVRDQFGESGEAEELMQKYGLTERDIFNAAIDLVKNK
jgi:transketolase